MRSHSLPGHLDPQNPQFRYPERNHDPRYLDPRSADPRYADPRRTEPRKADPRSAEPRMITAGGPKKISDKPRDDVPRVKSNNQNREKDQPQEQKPSAGKKIPMKRKENNPEKSPYPNRSGSKDWGQSDSFPFYPENDRGKINPFCQESGFSYNFTFKYPDQSRMNADRYF